MFKCKVEEYLVILVGYWFKCRKKVLVCIFSFVFGVFFSFILWDMVDSFIFLYFWGKKDVVIVMCFIYEYSIIIWFRNWIFGFGVRGYFFF